MKPSCLQCRFWQQKDESETGQCRRNAPRAAHFQARSGPEFDFHYAAWPPTQHDDWCGEFNKASMVRVKR